MSKDQDYIAKLERAITQKYGSKTVDNPHGAWDEEKVEQDGFLINQKLLNRDANRSCPVCTTYSFHPQDDLYMNKFECCKVCYIKWIEGREERWNTGWRPDNED